MSSPRSRPTRRRWKFEAVDEGILGKILVAEGTEGVKVNTPIAVLLEEGEDAADAAAMRPSVPAPAAAPAADSPGSRTGRRAETAPVPKRRS